MIILETERLCLRQLTADDAEFILRLLNEPSFIKNIGDRGVRTLEQAREFTVNNYIVAYQKHGFGLYLIEVKESGAAIGICGLVKRDALEHADIGYALLPEFAGQGYAIEAAQATVEYARKTLGINRLFAVVNRDNLSSIRLLEKLGFNFERMMKLFDNEPEIKLFALDTV
jgi:[ribosomal protein S5]-alanine N-acetyltransferase